MHKAMLLLDMHFMVAYSANFVFWWRWLRSGSSEDLFARLILWTSKEGVEIYLLGAPSTIQCDKWISGKYDIAALWTSRDFMQNGIVRSEFGGYSYLIGLWPTVVIIHQLWFSTLCLSTWYCALQHDTSYVDVVVFIKPWDLQYCPLGTYLLWVSWWEWLRHYPCMILCDHHRSGWSGTILGIWCFEWALPPFSDGWGIWPLLSLYIMVSILILELNLDTALDEVFDLYWFVGCDAHLHLLELNLDIALPLGHLFYIVCIHSWWFCIAWFSGGFIEILRFGFAGDCVM